MRCALQLHCVAGQAKLLLLDMHVQLSVVGNALSADLCQLGCERSPSVLT